MEEEKLSIQGEESVVRYFVINGITLDAFLQRAENPTKENKQSLKEDREFESEGIKEIVKSFIHNESPEPLISILRIARKRYRCFAVLETPYFDLEDWEAYAVFYSRSFTPFRRLCCRVHFFQGEENRANDLISALENGIQQSEFSYWLTDNLKLEYVGFFVLRPFRTCVVGRTVIKFDERPVNLVSSDVSHALEKTGQPYCTCAINNEFHLSSLTVNLSTAPAIQQNPVVGVCATASIWVASQILCGRFGLHKYPYNTITRQALRQDWDSTVNDDGGWKLGGGLNLGEIKQALARTGSIPFICSPTDSCHVSSQARMRLLAYTFVESGLPVILAFGKPGNGHAVTLVGHLLPTGENKDDVAESQAEMVFGTHPILGLSVVAPDRHLLMGQAIQLYYAHNDNYGPFDRLRFLKDREIFEQEESLKTRCGISTWQRTKAPEERKEKMYPLHGMIVSLPPFVQNNSPERLLLNAIKMFDNQFPPQEVEEPNEQEKIVWRCFLASAPDFKQSVVRREYAPEIKKIYNTMHLPLFIWVVEVTVLRKGQHVSYGESRKIDGEFLYDSTTPFYEPQPMSFRIGNCFIDFRHDEGLRKECDSQPQVRCFIPVKTRS